MDQNKLFKAFEKSRSSRDASSTEVKSPEALNSEGTKVDVLEVSKVSQVIADLVPTSTVSKGNASVKDIRNPHPMSVNEMRRNNLVYSGMKKRAVLNAYRELRIQLMDQSESSNIAVMISSVHPSDNSILTAFNLAISFALDVNSSALLIDCNPYGTEIQRLVTAKFTSGITDYVLEESIPLEDIIYPTGVDRVNVIPAGNNPAAAVELFSSQAMFNLVYELKNRYPDRFLILNAPPVLSSSEARVLTKHCDQTVLTVPYGSSSIDDIDEAVAAVGAENVTGVVYQQ